MYVCITTRCRMRAASVGETGASVPEAASGQKEAEETGSKSCDGHGRAKRLPSLGAAGISPTTGSLPLRHSKARALKTLPTTLHPQANGNLYATPPAHPDRPLGPKTFFNSHHHCLRLSP